MLHGQYLDCLLCTDFHLEICHAFERGPQQDSSRHSLGSPKQQLDETPLSLPLAPFHPTTVRSGGVTRTILLWAKLERMANFKV